MRLSEHRMRVTLAVVERFDRAQPKTTIVKLRPHVRTTRAPQEEELPLGFPMMHSNRLRWGRIIPTRSELHDAAWGRETYL